MGLSTVAKSLIHFAGWFLFGTRSDQTGRDPGGSATSWHRFQHDATCPYLGASTNFNVAEDASAGPDHDALTYFRMAVAVHLTGSAESYPLEHGDVVLNDGGLADHDAGAVVDHYAAAESGRRIDVDAKDRCHPALKIERQGAPPSMQQCVSKSIGLNGMEAFKEKQSFEGRVTGGIAFAHGDKISAGRNPDFGIIHGEGIEHLTKQHRRNVFAVEPLGNNVAQGILETGLVKHARISEAAKDGLFGCHSGGGLSDGIPNRVMTRELPNVFHENPQVSGAGPKVKSPGTHARRRSCASSGFTKNADSCAIASPSCGACAVSAMSW